MLSFPCIRRAFRVESLYSRIYGGGRVRWVRWEGISLVLNPLDPGRFCAGSAPPGFAEAILLLGPFLPAVESATAPQQRLLLAPSLERTPFLRTLCTVGVPAHGHQPPTTCIHLPAGDPIEVAESANGGVGPAVARRTGGPGGDRAPLAGSARKMSRSVTCAVACVKACTR